MQEVELSESAGLECLTPNNWREDKMRNYYFLHT